MKDYSSHSRRASDAAGSSVVTAMLCAGGVTALFVASKATRDALYLAHLNVTSLPTIVIATSAVSIGLVMISSKMLRRVAPVTFVPLLFVASAVLLLAEWLLVSIAPRAAAAGVYLQISGVGPMLGSGFWLIATERFDPRTAKKRFGQIAGVGTLGGLLGGVAAERIGSWFGVAAMLPVLAGVTLFCAWQVRRLAMLGSVDHPVTGSDPGPNRRDPLNRRASRRDVEPVLDLSIELAAEMPRSGLRVLKEAPYLRTLAALVLFGTTAAALIDYVFKAEAVAAFGTGESLLRFFALYYAFVSLATFVLQTFTSRLALEKLGLAVTTGSPSIALAAGGIAGLISPGLGSAIAARGAESVFRASFFRSGYELFYTPLASAERRAAKSLLDVGVDRLGDATGGGIIQTMLMLVPRQPSTAILAAAIGCSALALVVARRLHQAYIQTLERSLLDRAIELKSPDIEDVTTRTVFLRTTNAILSAERPSLAAAVAPASAERHTDPINLDPETQAILALRSRDRSRVMGALNAADPLPAALVPHVIPLLAWDAVASTALEALRKVAEERSGQLTDALLDPGQDFPIRRRLPRAFSRCTSQRAADGLLLGLRDQRFEVRFQCGRSLSAILKNNPNVKIDQEGVYEVVVREVDVSRPIWESRRLLDRLDEQTERSFVDEFVKMRTSQGLAHIFTLLSLVLPTEPLQIAFRGLHTDDERLRGTALEYLEGVLPGVVRERLWPFLDDPRPRSRAARAREDILEDLLRSNASIALNLEELEKRPNHG